MTPLRRFSLAARRAQVTSERRFGIVMAFTSAFIAADAVGAAVPTEVYYALLGWFACAAGYVLAVRGLRSPYSANLAQAIAYGVDLLLLSAVLAMFGGAWWLGPALHALVMVIAFATIPRRFASWVAAIALATYFLLQVAAYHRLFPHADFMGIVPLAGNRDLAVLVVGTGIVTLVVLALVLEGAIRWMRRTQERYRGLVQTVPETIVAVDLRGRVVSVNEAGLKLLGRAREELYGATLSSVLPQGMHARTMEKYRGAIGGAASSFDSVVGEGESRTFLDCSCTPIVEDDEVAGVLVVARDVTQSKRDAEALRLSEEQLRSAQKMEAVGQLAGGIAHDFNNVLSVILGYTQFLKATFDLEDERLDDVRAIESAAEGAASLTRQLLAFGRKQVVKPRLLDMNHCVRDLEEMLKRTLGSNIQVVTDLADGVTVSADPVQVEQVLLNLALNARDAMPDGGRLTIETRATDLSDAFVRSHPGLTVGRHVVLTVSDTGCGMDANTQARIFEPFFTTKPLGKGTGLGLPTVYGIVRQAGGYVWVYSEPGRGTAFKIYLPHEPAVEDAGVLRMPEITMVGGSETILLVDDADQLRPLLRRSLADFGYNVLEARNGQEAAELAHAYIGRIDLLVTDLVMPGMSGPALADELTAQRPDLRVLFMSGYAESAVSAGGRLRKGAAFIAKPFTPELLAREVRAVLDDERKEVA